jgi:hypothetical protein
MVIKMIHKKYPLEKSLNLFFFNPGEGTVCQSAGSMWPEKVFGTSEGDRCLL